MTTDIMLIAPERDADDVFDPGWGDWTCTPRPDSTGDFRRYAETLHLLADAIAADAARHPATRNTTAMIARRVREAADDCAGVARTREGLAA